MYRQTLSAVAIALTFIAFLPYIRSIQRGETRSHVFSWVIWRLTTFVAFFAQLAGQAGIGAWPIGVSGVISIYIALLAWARRADTEITRLDWFFFLGALSALPFWFFTADPLWAVVILTTVDLAGFGPTIRRAYFHPYGERLLFFGLFAARNTLVILALEHYSLTTVLFPAAVAIACVLLIAMIFIRRKAIGQSREHEPPGQAR